MKLIYGTYNPSKLTSMRKMLDGLNIEIIGIDSVDFKLRESDETGKDPLANAIEKATTYYKQLNIPVFSCDTGLFFDGIEEEDQPGVLVKRIHGEDLSYRDMVDYYGNLAAKYGGRLTAYYKNGICLYIDNDHIYKYDGEDICSSRFYIVDKPHKKYREGFPLDTLSVDIETMKYYYDLEKEKSESLGVISGFREFFIRSLNDYFKAESL